MPADDVWPPKPSLPDPLLEYDALIKEKLAARAVGFRGPVLFSLIRALRGSGLSLGQAFAAVDNYSARQRASLSAKDSATVSLIVLPMLISMTALLVSAIALALVGVFLQFRRHAILSQPHHQAPLLALDQLRATIHMAFSAALGSEAVVFICGYLAMQLLKRHKE